ncbi:hypothetical protein STUTZSP0542_28410 [Stutzerimonas marianensis]
MHDGKRGRLMHRVHFLFAERLVEHRAAAFDVITEQIRKLFRVRGAAGPAQQGDLLRDLQVFTLAVRGLCQHPCQACNTPGMPERLPHAEVTYLGDRRQRPAQ